MLSTFIKRIKLVFQYGKELDTILEELRKARELEEWEAKRHQLNLCKKHQQAERGGHYAEHNCDYCKLIAKMEELENGKCF